MSRKRKQRTYVKPLERKDIYDGVMGCPICGKEVSTFRIACFLEKHTKHSEFLGTCPICRK